MKSPGFEPAMEMPLTVSASVPEFEIVKVIDAVEPTFVDGKVKLVGLSDGEGGVETTPVLVRKAECGLPAALSLTVSEADSAFVVLGVNITVIGQLAPGARVEGHWFVCIKSA